MMMNDCFIKKLAALICIMLASLFTATAQVVTLDNYFNQETQKSKENVSKSFHYLWEDKGDSGFSKFGTAFSEYGAVLTTLREAPSAKSLKGSAVYIIVDPDTKKESLNPHFISKEDVKVIVDWVKKGGVLLLMANDSANAELPHLNELAARFGLHFNNDLQNHVINDKHFEDGRVMIKENALLRTTTKIYMKDVASITVKTPAKAALEKNGIILIATAKYGKGTVLAVGDPWLYNEYVNGRLPAGYENDKAAKDIAEWLLKQVPDSKNK
jgi:electron transfer flavoprotein alpha subunit